MSNYFIHQWQKLNEQLQFFQPYENMILKNRLSQKLFSKENEKVSECITEMKYTLKLLKSNDSQPEVINYCCERFMAQFRALQNLIQQQEWVAYPTRPPAPTQQVSSAQQKKKELIKQKLNQLPPEERLHEYYRFLRELTEKSEKALGASLTALPEQEREYFQALYLRLEERKRNCNESIDMLESYLSLSK